jgi:hypothetical protein
VRSTSGWPPATWWEVAKYRAEGIVTVEMEASCLFTVASSVGTTAAAAFTVSDVLHGEQWAPHFGSADILRACGRSSRPPRDSCPGDGRRPAGRGPRRWPAIIDVDTHEQLVKLFSDPARRKHIVGSQRHLLSGLAPCPKCGHGLKYRKFSSYRARSDSYACVRGVGGRCGGVAIKAELLEEYVTGAVLDALESPRVQEALRTGDDDGPRREDLLAKIQRAQEVRADARRDLADGVIDRNDWLDIRQRTEDTISTARREYDRPPRRLRHGPGRYPAVGRGAGGVGVDGSL